MSLCKLTAQAGQVFTRLPHTMLRSLVDMSLGNAQGSSLLGTSVRAFYNACIASLHADCACCAGVHAAAMHHAPQSGRPEPGQCTGLLSAGHHRESISAAA